MALYVNESSSSVYVGGKLIPAGQSRDVTAPAASPNTTEIEVVPSPEDPGGDGQTADGLPDPITAGKRRP